MSALSNNWKETGNEFAARLSLMKSTETKLDIFATITQCS